MGRATAESEPVDESSDDGEEPSVDGEEPSEDGEEPSEDDDPRYSSDPNAETAPSGIRADSVPTEGPADDFPPGRCQLCGWRNLETSVICEGCGGDLQTGEPPEVARFRPRRFDPRWVYLIEAALLTAVIVIGGNAVLRAGADKRALSRAVASRQAGDLVQAEEAYREAIELNPDNEAAWSGVAEVLFEQGNLAGARDAADAALARNGALAAAHLVRGRIVLAEGGDPKEALASLNSAYSVQPQLPDLLHLRARAFDLANNMVQARHGYRQALESDGASREAPLSRLRLAKILIRQNLVREAEEQLDLAQEDGAPRAELLAVRGDLRSRQGRYPEALEAYGGALALDGEIPAVLYASARLLHDPLARHEEALDRVERALAARSGWGRALRLKGRILVALERTDDAYQTFRAALRASRTADVLRSLAEIEVARDQLGDARGHLEGALELDQADVSTLVALAKVARRQKDYQTAVKHLTAASTYRLGGDASAAEIHYLLAESLLKTNDRAAAIQALEASSNADPAAETPLRRLGQLYLEDDRPDDAAGVLRKVAVLKPDDHAVALQLAELWVRKTSPRRYALAIELLDKILAKDPEHTAAQRLKSEAQHLQFREGR